MGPGAATTRTCAVCLALAGCQGEPSSSDHPTRSHSETTSTASHDLASHIVHTGPIPTTIRAIQQGLHPERTWVSVRGVVTASGSTGLFVQDPVGGPWSGIRVLLSPGWEARRGPIRQGDDVQLAGLYVELGDQSLIDLRKPTRTSLDVVGTAAVPLPERVPAAALQASTGEPWEGVLVELGEVKVTDPDLGYGTWLVSDDSGAHDVRIGDLSYAWPAQVAGVTSRGERFSRIAGTVDFLQGEFYVEPRGPEDFGSPALANLTHLGYGIGVVPSEANRGAELFIGWDAQNIGASSSAQADVGFWLSTDPIVSPDDTWVCAADLPTVAPGGYYLWGLAECMVPNVPPGAYYVVARLDASDRVAEFDETDNDSSCPLVINP